jgi:hypothetical protein
MGVCAPLLESHPPTAVALAAERAHIPRAFHNDEEKKSHLKAPSLPQVLPFERNMSSGTYGSLKQFQQWRGGRVLQGYSTDYHFSASDGATVPVMSKKCHNSCFVLALERTGMAVQ